jgi:trk system potassium uptake protein TrkA
MKEKIFAVFGLGAFGTEVCRVLSERGARVIAVDNQAQNIERIKDDVTQALLMDSTEEESLASAPLEDVDVGIIAMGTNVEASILTTALLKKIGIPYLLARAVSDIHLRVLRQVGADEVLNPEIEEGRRIAMKLLSPSLIETTPLSAEFSIAEMHVPSGFVGSTLQKLDPRNKYHINVIAVKRSETTIDDVGNAVREEKMIFPESNETFQDGDVLLIMGNNENISTLKDE